MIEAPLRLGQFMKLVIDEKILLLKCYRNYFNLLYPILRAALPSSLLYYFYATFRLISWLKLLKINFVVLLQQMKS